MDAQVVCQGLVSWEHAPLKDPHLLYKRGVRVLRGDKSIRGAVVASLTHAVVKNEGFLRLGKYVGLNEMK